MKRSNATIGTIIRFSFVAVREASKRSKRAARHAASFDETYSYIRSVLRAEPMDYVTGEKELTEAQQEELSQRTGPSLWLVKDEGIYIMDNAADRKGKPEVVYAEGLDASADCDKVRAVAGGDDFVMTIPLDWVELSLQAHGHVVDEGEPEYFAIAMKDNEVRLITLS